MRDEDTLELSAHDAAFVAQEVARGAYPNATAMMSEALAALRARKVSEPADLAELKDMLAERVAGPFLSLAQARAAAADMIAARRAGGQCDEAV